MIEFRDIKTKMREIWAGDNSDEAAIRLMAQFACRNGEHMTDAEFLAYVGELEPLEYMELWKQFKIATLTPKAS